ncbi:hypothetical protein B0J14DRAFT_686021, partial [Halenospora varia]
KLYSSIGKPSHVGKWQEVSKSIISYDDDSRESFIKEIEKLGRRHGFMILIVPPSPLSLTDRIILGNPLIAIMMLKHDSNAGLFVLAEELVREVEGGGTSVGVIAGSSKLDEDGDEKGELKKAAEILNGKLKALCRWI